MTGGKGGGEDHSQQELEKRVYHLKTLHDVCQEIGFLRGVDEILQTLLAMTMGTFGSLRGIVALFDTNEGRLENVAERGVEGDLDGTLSSVLDEDVIRYLKNSTGIEVLGVAEGPGRDGRKGLFDVLESIDMRIWAPFEVDGDLRGGVGLGEKLIGEPYSRDDQELLYTLATQGAVSVKNARLLEKMKHDEIVRANLTRYLSPHFVEKVMSQDVAIDLGGDRKTVTILFSDIRNFTSITETIPPEQLMHILNDYFTAMTACVFENQGIIDKFIGDAIMAVFDSLIELENPGRDAVLAAIEMMQILPDLNEKWKSQYRGFNMEIGIGVTSGDVFLGNIGSPERMEYTVIGDAVNVASRFSGIARGGQILVGRSTMETLGGEFSCREHPPMNVKGKGEKMEVFEVLY